MSTLRSSLLGVCLLVATIAPVRAASLSNGGFESGFASWGSFANASIQNTGSICLTAPLTCSASPTNGVSEALLTTPTTANVSNLESFLGLSAGSLLSQGVTGGSALQQTFTVSSGTLSFDWNFLTDETLNSVPNNDFAFIVLQGNLTKLTDVTSAVLASSDSNFFDSETGFRTFSQTLTGGTYTVSFVVANRNNTTFQSGLLVDNVNFQSVPEPSTWLGYFLFSIGFFAAIRRVRQRKNVSGTTLHSRSVHTATSLIS
jgi:hypothetical protein